MNLEESHTGPSPERRCGAESSGETELPLIVHLRGDEELVTEFNMDADQVMAVLGIKRSRLTQISGRELRVGRRRIGRYLRPVYRDVDVEAYKNWTRPTASHKAASEALEQAAEKMIDDVQLLMADLEQRTDALLIKSLHQKQLAALKERSNQLGRRLDEKLLDLRHLLSRKDERQKRALETISSGTKQLAEQMDQQKHLQEVLLLQMKGLQDALRQLAEECAMMKSYKQQIIDKISEQETLLHSNHKQLEACLQPSVQRRFSRPLRMRASRYR